MEAQHRAARNGSAARVAWAVVAATIVGVFLGIVGPFGSYLNGSVLTRIAYWVLSMWLCGALFWSPLLIGRPLAGRGGVPPLVAPSLFGLGPHLAPAPPTP